jgi:hypothetical protein
VIYPWATPADFSQRLFNGNPWAHVEIDLETDPSGNHFFAYALKDSLLELLDPKPLPYQDRDPGSVNLSEYLPGA